MKHVSVTGREKVLAGEKGIVCSGIDFRIARPGRRSYGFKLYHFDARRL